MPGLLYGLGRFRLGWMYAFYAAVGTGKVENLYKIGSELMVLYGRYLGPEGVAISRSWNLCM